MHEKWDRKACTTWAMFVNAYLAWGNRRYDVLPGEEMLFRVFARLQKSEDKHAYLMSQLWYEVRTEHCVQECWDWYD